jgi:hypothetical protein
MAIDLSCTLIVWKIRDCGQNRFDLVPIRLLHKATSPCRGKSHGLLQPRQRSRAILDFRRDSIGWPEFSLSNLP